MFTLRSVRWWLFVAVVAAIPLSLQARDPKSSKGLFRTPASQTPPEKSEEEEGEEEDSPARYGTTVKTDFIGDHTSFAGLEPVALQGVGLVVGLNGTGGDPAPSAYRTALMDDLKKNSIPNPNSVLRSPNTALVLVQAYLRPLLDKGEKIDVEIRVPDSANVKSLEGGWLMETYLSDSAFVPGRGVLKGHAYAKAEGAVLLHGLGSDAKKNPAMLKRGRVLGGATILRERELSLFLRNDFRSIRNATRMAETIGRRFHHFDKQGIKKPMAEAKTDQKIELSVHPKYKHNYPRYLQVIRHMAWQETPVAMRVRLQKLQKDIFVPEASESTALQLEAIGDDGVPVLKHGLTSPLMECRFHSAVALAYLGDTSGLSVLVEAARKERAFRVFAFAAMSTLEDADAHTALHELMNETVAETRYGAFRALWTLDKNDPFIRGETLGLKKDVEQKKGRNLGDYKLHVLETTGEPLVHTTLRSWPEVVLFGGEQEFRPPMYLTAGRHIMVTAQPGASTVTLARFEVGKPDERREVSLRVADVIRAADELGATYPDVVTMLADASKQKNLAHDLAADELPEGGRTYYRPDTGATKPGAKRETKVGKDNFTPNMFPEQDDPEEAAAMRDQEKKLAPSPNSGRMANVPHEDPAPPAQKEFPSDTTAKNKDGKSGEKSSSKGQPGDETSKPKSLFPWPRNSKKSEK